MTYSNDKTQDLNQIMSQISTQSAPQPQPQPQPFNVGIASSTIARGYIIGENDPCPNKNLFRNNAPALWQHGLPVIPLRPRGKEPLSPNWSQYKDKMPTPAEQQHWLMNYPDCNIGLPLGAQSGCIAIDIDTEDKALISVIDAVVGHSPWVRVGQKGKVMLFKYSGQKACKIKDIDGKMICEILSAGNQVVLPPSIHPKTQKPYVANCPITEVCHALPELSKDIETLLRQALQAAGVTLSHSGWTRTTDYVSQGSRDVKMTTMSGFLAAGVIRGELSLLEAIDRMYAWKDMCVENVAGDDVDIEKGVRNLIQFMIQDVVGPKQKALPNGWDSGLTEKQKQEWGLNFTQEHQEWTLSQLREYLKVEFEKHEAGTLQRIAAVEYTLQRIANSPHLSSLDIDIIFKYICQSNKQEFTTASLKKRLMDIRAGEIKGTDHTEIAKAVASDLLRTGEVRYFNTKFWQYRGSNWEILENQEILKVIADNYGHLPAAKRSSDHLGILRVVQTVVPQGKLNTLNIRGMNFANCFVDIDGKMCPHSPAFGCTYTLPFRYRPELGDDLINNAPMFFKFLKSVWGMEEDFAERVKALREAMAVTYFGIGPSFARAILLYGIAGSGKSQLLEIVKRLLPPSVVSYVTPYKFDDKFEVTELSKSLLNICGELQEDKPIPGAAFKQIIDGSSMNGQYKGMQIFSFVPNATHWFASNHLPKTRDVSEGFNRRWLVLTFNHPVAKKDKVRDIGNIIAAEEREAIAAWVLGCIKDVTKTGDLTLPPSHIEIMRDIASENDTIFFYLTSEEGPGFEQENCQGTLYEIAGDEQGYPNGKEEPLKKSTGTNIAELYEKYTAFCYSKARARPVGLRKFSQRLRELGIFMNFRVDGLMVYGLTLKKDGIP